jgi:hypothetical protein
MEPQVQAPKAAPVRSARRVAEAPPAPAVSVTPSQVAPSAAEVAVVAKVRSRAPRKVQPRPAVAEVSPSATEPVIVPGSLPIALGPAVAGAEPPPIEAPLPLEIPPILLEDDATPVPAVSGPGDRFLLAPTAPVEAPVTVRTEGLPAAEGLPSSYGTRELFLIARDPEWLYAHWDFSDEQVQLYESFAAQGQLTLKVFRDHLGSEPSLRIPVSRGARSWFVHVGVGGAAYVVELGYWDRAGAWQTLAVSSSARTPLASPHEPAEARLATVPVNVPFAELLAQAGHANVESAPLLEGFFAPESSASRARTISIQFPESARQAGPSSLEARGLAQSHAADQAGALAASALVSPTSPSPQAPLSVGPAATQPGGVSSEQPSSAGGAAPRAFWFNVNAELIVYGATEPDARVSIAGRAVRLRPDGTFSLRFALPDGRFELPIVAIAAQDDDGRSAVLKLSRQTEHWGVVEAHPQDPALKPPGA